MSVLSDAKALTRAQARELRDAQAQHYSLDPAAWEASYLVAVDRLADGGLELPVEDIDDVPEPARQAVIAALLVESLGDDLDPRAAAVLDAPWRGRA